MNVEQDSIINILQSIRRHHSIYKFQKLIYTLPPKYHSYTYFSILEDIFYCNPTDDTTFNILCDKLLTNKSNRYKSYLLTELNSVIYGSEIAKEGLS